MLIIPRYSYKIIQTKKRHKTFSIYCSQNKARIPFGRKEGKKKRPKNPKTNHHYHQHHHNKEEVILSQLLHKRPVFCSVKQG